MFRITFIFLLLAICKVQAQRFDFGKVSEKELAEKIHPLDPEASAAVLYKKAKTYFEYNNQWQYVHEVEVRIKIYNKEGFDQATIEVPLYRPGTGKNHLFSGFKAYTYNLEGNKINRDRLKNEGQFQEHINDVWMNQKFTFPNVKEGSVLEYTYKITSSYISSLPWFYFQEKIPVNFAEYTLNVPEYLGYKSYSKEFFPIKRKESRKNSNFTFKFVPRKQDGYSATVSHKTEFSTLRYTLNTVVYSAENVIKMVEEDYVNNINNYLTSIKHELEWLKMPNSPVKNYTTTWEDVIKNIYKHDNFGKELEQKNYFEPDVARLVQESNSKIEKTKAIFEFVKQKIIWNGKHNNFTSDGVKKAYMNKTGNVAEINLILTAMLRHAGIEANPVLVSTKSYGIPLFPTIDGFNYVVCQVEQDNKVLLLDATSKYSSPNILPEKTFNWYGRLVRNDGKLEEVNLMSNVVSLKVTNMDIQLLENGSIEGKLRNVYTDQQALSYREMYADIDESKYISNLENKYHSMSISDYKSQNKKDAYKPMIEDFSFIKDYAYDKIGDKLYIQPMFFLAMTKNPFKAETREYPIDFSYPYSDIQQINISLPEGYKIESLPESAILQLPDELGEFKFMISENGSNIQLRVTSEIRTTLIPSIYYDALKQYYTAMVEKQTEKIVISKT